MAAVSGHLCGNALVGLAVAGGLVQHGHVGVGMHVDEAGGDHEAGPIDNAPRPSFVQAANGLDLAVIDPQVGFMSKLAGSVDDGSILDE